MSRAFCKRCSRYSFMTTPEDRARYDAEIFAAIALWTRTSVHERGTDNAVCEQLARASVYAEYLVAADQGYCRRCSPEMVEPAITRPAP